MEPVVSTPETAGALSAPLRRLPRTKRKRARLDWQTYARGRANGLTMEEAIVAAGSLSKSHGARTSSACVLEKRPEVVQLIERERNTIRSMSERGWRAAMKWACDTLEGLPEASGTKDKDGKDVLSFPTRFDKANAASFLGRCRGEFIQRLAIEDGVRLLPFVSLLELHDGTREVIRPVDAEVLDVETHAQRAAAARHALEALGL